MIYLYYFQWNTIIQTQKLDFFLDPKDIRNWLCHSLRLIVETLGNPYMPLQQIFQTLYRDFFWSSVSLVSVVGVWDVNPTLHGLISDMMNWGPCIKYRIVLINVASDNVDTQWQIKQDWKSLDAVEAKTYMTNNTYIKTQLKMTQLTDLIELTD